MQIYLVAVRRISHTPLIHSIVEEYFCTAQIAKQKIELLLDHLEPFPRQSERLHQFVTVGRFDKLLLLSF